MPDKPKPKGKGKGKGKGLEAALKRKVGGFPVWAWAAAGIGAFLVFRHFSGGATPGSDQGLVAAPGDQSGAGGGSGSGDSGGAGVGGSLPQDLLDALNAGFASLGDQIAAGQSVPFDPGVNADGYDPGYGASNEPAQGQVITNADATDTLVWGINPVNQPAGNDKASILSQIVDRLGIHPFATFAHATDFASEAQARSELAAQYGFKAPFGGVVGTRRLANGGTVTTYATGRQVQQQPGHPAYVISRGGSGSAPQGSVGRGGGWGGGSRELAPSNVTSSGWHPDFNHIMGVPHPTARPVYISPRIPTLLQRSAALRDRLA